jgi:peptide/nickel transport system ATP-binding protein
VTDGGALLDIRGLRVAYATRAGDVPIIPGLDLSLRAGEALGLVGESGCGKSTVALSIVRYLGRAGRITDGRIMFEGRDLTTLSAAALMAIRGRRIAMVYQDPMASLNPVMTVGRQLMEVPITHDGADASRARARALAMLREVRLADPEAVMDRYPHQLSGGQQQRIVIAMALIAEPALLIMDEPTTGLDVTVEAAVLDLVRELRRRHRSAILFISHNLGTVVRVCDRVGVMYRGELVEEGSVRHIFTDPRHPYTRGLLECLPTLGRDKRQAPLVPIDGQVEPAGSRSAGCGFASRCAYVDAVRCMSHAIPLLPRENDAGHRVACVRADELPRMTPRPGSVGAHESAASPPAVITAKQLTKSYPAKRGLLRPRRGPVNALRDVDLSVARRRTLAIVGESGCGKSTLAKVLAGIETATSGEVTLDGVEIGSMPVDVRSPALKRKLQMVFQNPESTLNPSHTVGYAIGRALRRLAGGAPTHVGGVARLLQVVKLAPEMAMRRPRQLSGGEKQRVAIARALAGDPDVIVADEPVSALDVSVQAAVINLLNEIQAAHGATLVFISHDLAVVRYIADDVAVMYLGSVAELGPVDRVFAPPYHPYTEALLSAVPIPDPDAAVARILLEGAVPRAEEIPAGCPFATRCPRRIGAICDETPPPVQQLAAGHRIACHIPAKELAARQVPL